MHQPVAEIVPEQHRDAETEGESPRPDEIPILPVLDERYPSVNLTVPLDEA